MRNKSIDAWYERCDSEREKRSYILQQEQEFQQWIEQQQYQSLRVNEWEDEKKKRESEREEWMWIWVCCCVLYFCFFWIPTELSEQNQKNESEVKTKKTPIFLTCTTATEEWNTRHNTKTNSKIKNGEHDSL